MTMTDRELQETAAKAAGYEVRWHELWGCFVHVKPFNIDNPPTISGQRLVWLPLTDDGDALRLAVKLGLKVDVYRMTPLGYHPYPCVEVRGYVYRKSLAFERADDNGASLLAATRRAIVLAAAAIGEIALDR